MFKSLWKSLSRKFLKELVLSWFSEDNGELSGMLLEIGVPELFVTPTINKMKEWALKKAAKV